MHVQFLNFVSFSATQNLKRYKLPQHIDEQSSNLCLSQCAIGVNNNNNNNTILYFGVFSIVVTC